MIEKLGGRKFIFAILALVLAFALVLLKIVTAESFLEFVKWVAGIFIAGNAVVDSVGIIKGE